MSRVRTIEHVADVRRRPGTQRPVDRSFPASALGHLATSAAAVPPSGEVALAAVVEATGVDIVLTGTLSFPWEGDCRRCLDAVTGTAETDLREVFEPKAVEGETWPVEGDAIDLGPVLRDAVLLALPLVPLCSDDCVGPDPDRFPATVEAPTTEHQAGDDETADDRPAGDPRWAALDELRFD
jgi:uncharacterized protein